MTIAVAWLKSNEPVTTVSLDDISEKIAAAKANPLAEHGGDRKTIMDAVTDAKSEPLIVDQGNNVTLISERGNATDYTLRRLARDCPEMLDRIEAGKLLAEMEKQNPGDYQRSHDVTVAPSLGELGISKMQSSRWQLAAKRPRSRLVDAF